jgi:peptidoglycan/LPS O-acetylase OafA/YrhL
MTVDNVARPDRGGPEGAATRCAGRWDGTWRRRTLSSPRPPSPGTPDPADRDRGGRGDRGDRARRRSPEEWAAAERRAAAARREREAAAGRRRPPETPPAAEPDQYRDRYQQPDRPARRDDPRRRYDPPARGTGGAYDRPGRSYDRPTRDRPTGGPGDRTADRGADRSADRGADRGTERRPTAYDRIASRQPGGRPATGEQPAYRPPSDRGPERPGRAGAAGGAYDPPTGGQSASRSPRAERGGERGGAPGSAYERATGETAAYRSTESPYRGGSGVDGRQGQADEPDQSGGWRSRLGGPRSRRSRPEAAPADPYDQPPAAPDTGSWQSPPAGPSGWHDQGADTGSWQAAPPSGPQTAWQDQGADTGSWQGVPPAGPSGWHDQGTDTGSWQAAPPTAPHTGQTPQTAWQDQGADTGSWQTPSGWHDQGADTGSWQGVPAAASTAWPDAPAGPPTGPTGPTAPTGWPDQAGGPQGWDDGPAHAQQQLLAPPLEAPVDPHQLTGPPLAEPQTGAAAVGTADPDAYYGYEDEPQRPDRRRQPDGLDDGPKLPRVPGFDGLRGLALIAVLAFHQGFDLARGGFLGISSFFTLSGFLVATLALAEWSQTGRLALGRFWERRARRIIPGVVATLAGIVVLQFVLRVGSGPGFRGDVLWSLGYATNWRAVVADEQISGIFIDPSPVQHLWSVALELQLLVIVPLLFVVLMTLTRRHWRATGVVFAGAALASFAVAHLTAERDGNGGIAFFGTHTRAGEMLVGVALAYAVLSPAFRRIIETDVGQKAVRFGGPAALVVLAWLWHATSLGDPNLLGGITALNSVLTAWVVLAATTSGPTSTFLGAWPLRTLGRFSFAAYLVHWPIYLTLDSDRIGLDSNILFVVRVAATLAVAVAATYLVEQPFRERLRMPRLNLAGLLGASTVVLVAAVLVLPVQPPPNVSLTIDDGNGPGDLDAVAPSGGSEVGTIALVGDSLAASLTPGFQTWDTENTDQQFRVHTHVTENCPTSARGPAHLAGETIGDQTACVGWEPRLPRLLDRADPDAIVVVAGIDDLGDREIDREWRHLGDPLFDDWLAGQLEALADRLAEPGVPVLWATVPHVRMPGADGDWTRVADNDPRRVDRLNELIRRTVSGRDGFQIVDLQAGMQELPRGGEFSTDDRQDGKTLTAAGADRMAAWLAPRLLEALGAEEGSGQSTQGSGGATTTTTTPGASTTTTAG